MQQSKNMLQKFAHQQLRDFVAVLKNIDDQAYATAMEPVFNSSIGQHTRHIIEFYQIFIQSYATGTLCYDKRNRLTELESSTEQAIQAIEDILLWLESPIQNKEILLETSVLGKPNFISTQVSRELLYLLEHTTHHLASIRIGISRLNLTISVPSDLGIAYSSPKVGSND